MPSLEEKQAERREINKRRLRRLCRKKKRATWKAKRPKGKWRGGDKYDYHRCLYEYRAEFNEIVDTVLAVCRGHTEVTTGNKKLEHMVRRLRYFSPWINKEALDREDIEQELLLIWHLCYQRCRKEGWSLKYNFINYAYYYLPKYIGPHINSVYTTNTNEVSYELDSIVPFELDMNWVIQGSDQFPMSLFDKQERYLIFLLQEYPGKYAKVAKMMRIPTLKVWSMVEKITTRLKEELDATPNSTRSTQRRDVISPQGNQGDLKNPRYLYTTH